MYQFQMDSNDKQTNKQTNWQTNKHTSFSRTVMTSRTVLNVFPRSTIASSRATLALSLS